MSPKSTQAAREVDEKSEVAEITRVIRNSHVDYGGERKSFWQMTRETFGMIEGKSKATDVIVDNDEQALKAIKDKMEQAKAKDKNNPQKWDLPWTPTKELDATIDDYLLAFCRWAAKDSDDKKNMNIDKAFRRLEHYVEWMYDARDSLDEPLTVESIAAAAKAFDMKLAHDSSGRLVWWWDWDMMDAEAFRAKTIPAKNAVRFCVWSTHVSILDTKAQANGMIFIQDIGNVGFLEIMSWFPTEVSAKLDRLSFGVTPMQMKGIYMIHAAAWIKLMFAFMKPFLSKKMRKRMVVYGKKEDAKSAVTNELGGKEYIPKDCCGFGGTVEKDIIFGKYIKE